MLWLTGHYPIEKGEKVLAVWGAAVISSNVPCADIEGRGGRERRVRPGRVTVAAAGSHRSSAWIAAFSSTYGTTACSVGLRAGLHLPPSISQSGSGLAT